jgi:hypothetical protein
MPDLILVLVFISILLALIGLTYAFSKCNCHANRTMTSECQVLSRRKPLKDKGLFQILGDLTTRL